MTDSDPLDGWRITRMIRETYGPGQGGRFSMTIKRGRESFDLHRLSGRSLLSYTTVSGLAISAGFVLPYGAEARAAWRDMIGREVSNAHTLILPAKHKKKEK